MSYDEGGWKRRLVNGIFAWLSMPLYVFKKMRDYSQEMPDTEEIKKNERQDSDSE